ncbi:MAG: glycine dehydrogenase (aminomethyl-transferring), partial [Bacteroidales bacterium]|nr:glycine dehydrogenase (aminomethyl-transferring) [Bacteroidales bacterium]
IMSLVLLMPPGEWGADVVVGSTQRFGIPMGYGGPHAAYFATKEEFKRNIPGRIIGISKDANGDQALRMALQTREQHIKRERATSNICTAQALLAIMAGMFAVYHGPDGIREIATDIHKNAVALCEGLKQIGLSQLNKYYFDTLLIELPAEANADELRKIAISNKINFRYIGENHVGISVDETTAVEDIELILQIFAEFTGKDIVSVDFDENRNAIPEKLNRQSTYLQGEVFNTYHSETEMMRYMKKLENRDLALNRTMIPLGSCTMKLNAAAELFSLSWPEFGGLHPFIPVDQAEGYKELVGNLENDLCEITGFAAMSFQPNSGAAGEYAGLTVIHEYLQSIGQGHRNICLIPSSA